MIASDGGPYTLWWFRFDGMFNVEFIEWKIVDSDREWFDRLVEIRDEIDGQFHMIMHDVRDGFWTSRSQRIGEAVLDNSFRGYGYIVAPSDNKIVLVDGTELNYPPFHVNINASFAPAYAVADKGGELAYWLTGEGDDPNG